MAPGEKGSVQSQIQAAGIQVAALRAVHASLKIHAGINVQESGIKHKAIAVQPQITQREELPVLCFLVNSLRSVTDVNAGEASEVPSFRLRRVLPVSRWEQRGQNPDQEKGSNWLLAQHSNENGRRGLQFPSALGLQMAIHAERSCRCLGRCAGESAEEQSCFPCVRVMAGCALQFSGEQRNRAITVD